MTLRHIFPDQSGADSPRSLAAVKLANLNQAFLMKWRDDLLLRPGCHRRDIEDPLGDYLLL